MHPIATDLIVEEIRLRISQGDCPSVPARNVEQLEDVIDELATRLERARKREHETLAAAIKKFAPDLAADLSARWAGAMREQDERLEAFLVVLR